MYAIYRGDEFLFMGTREECAKEFGVTKNTIHFYSTNGYKKRIRDDNYKTRIVAERVDD